MTDVEEVVVPLCTYGRGAQVSYLSRKTKKWLSVDVVTEAQFR